MPNLGQENHLPRNTSEVCIMPHLKNIVFNLSRMCDKL